MTKSASKEFQEQNYVLEREAKFVMPASKFWRILNDLSDAPFSLHRFERDERTNVYYDTKKKFHLYRVGLECRGREKNKSKNRFDLKTPQNMDGGHLGPDENGVFSRREYRYEAKHGVPRIDKFACPFLNDPALQALSEKELKPWVQGHFQRSRFTYTPEGFPDTELEVAFETGHYETIDGQERGPDLHIIEVELKTGDYEGLRAAIDRLKRKYDIEACLKTKGEMGMEFVAPYLKQARAETFESARQNRADHYQVEAFKAAVLKRE